MLGLRKPPQLPSGSSYENYLLAQWKEMKNIIDEQARRRFQQERQQQQQYSFPNNEQLADEVSGPGFTYRLPIQYSPFTNDEEPPFAVGPGHPKFYEKIGHPIKDSTAKSEPVFTYKNVLGSENEPVHLTSDGIFHKVKAPMNVNPKIIPNDDTDTDTENTYDISKSKDVLTREDLKKLFENLEQKGQGKAIVNVLQPFTQSQNDVAKKPVDLNSAWVIGVIAGVSAAFTVGLLAIGIGWYT